MLYLTDFFNSLEQASSEQGQNITRFAKSGNPREIYFLQDFWISAVGGGDTFSFIRAKFLNNFEFRFCLISARRAFQNRIFRGCLHIIQFIEVLFKGSSKNHLGEVRLLITRYKPKAQCRGIQSSENCVPKGRDTQTEFVEPTLSMCIP